MKQIITNLVLLLCIMCMAVFSYAAENQLEATIEISSNTTEVSVGDKVTFTLVTRDIANATDNGKIYAIGGKVTYDKNFFEVDSTNGITLGDTGLFNSTNAVTEGGTNGTITLKVKEGATGSATVIFTDLTASDGRLEDMETLGTAITENQDFTITLKVAQEPTTPPSDNTTDSEEKNETVIPETNKNEVTNNQQKEESTTNKDKLPQTGIGLGLTITVVALAVLGMIAYLKYNKLSDIK